MRILLATDQYPPMLGGVPTVSHDLAVGLASQGHQVWVIAPSSSAMDRSYRETGVETVRFASIECPGFREYRISIPTIGVVREIFKRAAPDVVHIQSVLTIGRLAQYVAHISGIPVIATNHYLPENLSRTLAKNRCFSTGFFTFLNLFYNQCDFVTAPTNYAVALLRARGLQAPSAAISNGIDLNRYAPGKKNSAIRSAYQLPANRPLVLHVNRLAPEKRIDVILNALPKMKVSAHLALVGSGPVQAELQSHVNRLGLHSRVSFLGRLPDSALQELWREADFSVIASDAELQSLSTMEAMACGLPVVAADAGALPELVQHGRNGLLFPAGDSQALSECLDRLSTNQELRQYMGQEGRKLISLHDRRQVLMRWDEIYGELSSRRVPAIDTRQKMAPVPGSAQVEYPQVAYSRRRALAQKPESSQ